MRENLSVHRCSVGFWLLGAAGLLSICGALFAGRVADASVAALGSRLELLVDDYLIERWSGGATARLHPPEPRGLALVHDEPWEGNSCGYHTVFRDGPLYRMYYKSYVQLLPGDPPAHEPLACYAESTDGIHWKKPVLGLIEFDGSKRNNIVRLGVQDFSPFKDGNPACAPDARYKAVGAGKGGLYGFKSADAIHWSPLGDVPIITKGAFDTQNIAFWDAERNEYRAYVRDFRNRLRDIRTATSRDFAHWSEPEWLSYPGAPEEQLYTNQVLPYYRAPHIFLGFPARYIDHGWTDSTRELPELEHRLKRSQTSSREGSALTDGLFMSSRDGRLFRRWGEAFIRPGLRDKDNWVYGDNFQNWGLVETKSDISGAPDELSIYATESYWTGTSSQLRRFVLRVDGFVSVHAPLAGGEVLTRPLTFTGARLLINYSTSAAGSLRVEIQDAEGHPLAGYGLEECPEIFGDRLEQHVRWKGGDDVALLAGRVIRLRFVMKDADLFALRFR